MLRLVRVDWYSHLLVTGHQVQSSHPVKTSTPVLCCVFIKTKKANKPTIRILDHKWEFEACSGQVELSRQTSALTNFCFVICCWLVGLWRSRRYAVRLEVYCQLYSWLEWRAIESLRHLLPSLWEDPVSCSCLSSRGTSDAILASFHLLLCNVKLFP